MNQLNQPVILLLCLCTLSHLVLLVIVTANNSETINENYLNVINQENVYANVTVCTVINNSRALR